MMDLVLNHTSEDHPWFRSAVARRDSPYRDWYVWSDEEPQDRWDGTVFPGAEKETWNWSATPRPPGTRHRFYRFQPDLNTDHPAVREEFRKIMAFWLRLGVCGFRIDAAPFLIESRDGATCATYDYAMLREIREAVSWQRHDAALLAEANVPTDELLEYFGSADGQASRAMMMFAFRHG